MDISIWLARSAAWLRRFSRKATPSSDLDPIAIDRDRLRAARSLRTRLPAHLRRDIGLGDGGLGDDGADDG